MVEPVRHRRTKGAATDMLEPKATASHLDSTQSGHWPKHRCRLSADFVAKGIAANLARALRRLRALQEIPMQFQKTVDQSRTPMVDDPTSAALHGRRLRSPSSRKHRTAGADHRKAIGSRDVGRAVRIHAGRACPPQSIPPAPQAQNADHRLLPSMRHWCTLPNPDHVEAPAAVPSRRGE
jgi:hypothetical protein